MTKCKHCMGFGFWPIGDLCAIGECDADEWGDLVVKCPWCGAGVSENDKYYVLKGIKDMEEKSNGKNNV